MDRFYSVNFRFIENDEFHHLYRVLRHKKGDKILVFDGRGNEFLCEIKEILKDKAIIETIQKIENREMPFHLAVAQSLIKENRWDFFLEKITEIGVKEIYPLITKYCVVKLKETKERWRKILLNAAKQSHRQIIPKIHHPLHLDEILKIAQNYDLKLFGNPYSVYRKLSFKNLSSCLLLIGPEGGLADEEVSKLRENGFIDFNLGRFILRSETSAIVASYLIISSISDGLFT